ncbi:DUF262 domain-containing protein [Bifidobacterium apicola]|uniref:DUF262 domain-containing protein n=1 Tax=Bifidobacterium apicola TaxID=3230739 RepID=UPI0036F3D195
MGAFAVVLAGKARFPMDAGPVELLSLIADRGKRFIVPVYQRPYSWDEQQCEQLWNDVLDIGRLSKSAHFMGSVVWIQKGTMGGRWGDICLYYRRSAENHNCQSSPSSPC